MSQYEPWHLDENAEELYERYLVPAKLGLWAADLVALGAPRSGECVLDVTVPGHYLPLLRAGIRENTLGPAIEAFRE